MYFGLGLWAAIVLSAIFNCSSRIRTTRPACFKKTNIVFVIDDTNGVTKDEYQKTKLLIKKFVRSVSASANVGKGAVVVSNRVVGTVPITTDVAKFESGLTDIPYDGSANIQLLLGATKAFEMFKNKNDAPRKVPEFTYVNNVQKEMTNLMNSRSNLKLLSELQHVKNLPLFKLHIEGFDCANRSECTYDIQKQVSTDGDPCLMVVKGKHVAVPTGTYMSKVHCKLMPDTTGMCNLTAKGGCKDDTPVKPDPKGDPCYFMLGDTRMAVAQGTYFNADICSQDHDTNKLCLKGSSSTSGKMVNGCPHDSPVQPDPSSICYFLLGGTKMAVANGTFFNATICSQDHDIKKECSKSGDPKSCVGPNGVTSDPSGSPCHFMLGGIRMMVAYGTYFNTIICEQDHDVKNYCPYPKVLTIDNDWQDGCRGEDGISSDPSGSRCHFMIGDRLTTVAHGTYFNLETCTLESDTEGLCFYLTGDNSWQGRCRGENGISSDPSGSRCHFMIGDRLTTVAHGMYFNLETCTLEWDTEGLCSNIAGDERFDLLD